MPGAGGVNELVPIPFGSTMPPVAAANQYVVFPGPGFTASTGSGEVPGQAVTLPNDVGAWMIPQGHCGAGTNSALEHPVKVLVAVIVTAVPLGTSSS